MKNETVFVIVGILYIIGLLLNRSMIKDIQRQQETLDGYRKELINYMDACDKRNAAIYQQYLTVAEILGIRKSDNTVE